MRMWMVNPRIMCRQHLLGEHVEIHMFHSENKLLLKAFNEKEMRILGRIVARREQYSIDRLMIDYEKHLLQALKRAPRCGSQINVLMNSMGYFSKSLFKFCLVKF